MVTNNHNSIAQVVCQVGPLLQVELVLEVREGLLKLFVDVLKL